MPNYWLLKTEPEKYSYTDLERDKQTVWDGVENAQALIHIRKMKPGDVAVIYHTGDERRAVGIAHVISDPYADPAKDDAKLAVVDVQPKQALKQPVSLGDLKADAHFAESPLVKQGRLSVVPLTPEQWTRLLNLGQTDWSG